MTNRELHIFTSEKGSAGKTSQALSLAMYLMSRSYNVCIIDLNMQNPDLEDVFANFLATVRIIDGKAQITYQRRELPVAGNTRTGKKFVYVRPHSRFERVMVWAFLKLVIETEDRSTMFVVDTGENLHNLIPLKSEREQVYRVFKDMQVTPTIWHTWLWSAPASMNKMRRLNEAVQFMQGFKGWTDNHLVNVFNVYRVAGKAKRLHRLVRSVKRRFDDPDMQPLPLSFERICKCVEIVAKRLGISDPSKDEVRVREIPDLWCETFERMLEVMGHQGVFSNIFILETVPRVTMFVDQILMSRPTRVAQIRQILGRFYDNFVEFVKIYEIGSKRDLVDTIDTMVEQILEDESDDTEFTIVEVDSREHA